MKAFKHTFLLLLSFGLLCSAVNAQQFTVSGTVFFGDNQDPAPDYFVFIYDGDEAVSEEEVYYTDLNGNYSATLSPETDGLPYIVKVETFDFCTGESIIQQVEFTVDPQTVEGIDFAICTDFNPPPPPEGCDAYFTYETPEDEPLTVTFIDLSYSDLDEITYEWDFGDGNTSTDVNPVHIYAEDGQYDVTLTINSGDCTSTVIQTVFIGEDPCGCDGNDNLVCLELFPGAVIQLLECEALCQGFTEDQFVDGPCDDPIFEECHAYFAIDYEANDNPLTVSFEDLSSAQSDTSIIISWEWDFGDGNTSTVQNPTHTYNQVGVYDVILTITTDDGCTSTTIQHISIGFENCDCEDEEFDPICVVINSGFIFTFNNPCLAECAGFGEDTWVDCEDDCLCEDILDPVCITLQDGIELFFPNACWAECEGYTEDQFGQCDGFEECHASFYYSFEDSLTVVFEDWSSTFDGEIVSWAWNFGDGNTSTEQNPTHTYAEEGVYEVILTITTDSGCTSTYSQPVSTQFDDCDCEDEESDPVCVELFPGFTFTFDNPCLAQCAGYGEDTWVECNNSGGCECPDIYDPVCVFDPAWGVTLTFENACYAECEGYTDEDFVDCDGNSGFDCYADFFMTPTDNELTVLFEDFSFANIGNVVAWEWDFGDGNTSTEQYPTHTYAEEGIYEVTLAITTDEGCTSSITLHVCLGEGGYYEGPDCQAIFYFTQHDDDLSTFDFINLSFGDNIDSYFWDFGDGNTSTAQNPTHTYAEEGVYTITLTISGGEGDEVCESSISVVLFTNPNAWYETECNALFVPFIVSETNEVFFLNLSSTDAVSFAWDFGDGITSEDPLASHQYAESGTYEVSLTITTADGCESTYFATINLGDADFTGSQQFSLSSSTEDQLAINNKLTAQPNPTSGDILIDFTAQNSDLYEINIISMEGQILRTIQTRAQEGKNQVNTDIDDLPAGLYLIQLQSKQGIQTTKVVKK